jgi:exopolysaccharide/PEP-CTERM locus tyrosine autokinase
MSLVEKAAEKLKTRQPEPVERPRADVSATAAVNARPTTVERAQRHAQQRAPVADAPIEAEPPCHIDIKALRRAGLAPIEDEATARFADELRRVKRPLLNNLDRPRANALTHGERIVVTSAVPGEGKTFTAINLAMSLAREPDFEVLLIDGDIPKANITQVLGLQEHAGLMDVLADETRHPAEAIAETDVPNLRVVPAGQRHPLTAELFGGRRMNYVLDALGKHNRQRLMVFDSSPLLATSESQVMAAHMGQVLMIVAAGRTRKQELNTALQSLDESQYIGFVLNMSRLPASESHYYYSQYNYYAAARTREG